MFLKPDEVFNHLYIEPTSRFGDFGAGAGHYSLLAAKKLAPGGAVYAFDINGGSLDRLRTEGEKYAADFYTLDSDLNQHIPLRDNLLDSAVVANVLHQLEAREYFARELSRVMRPGGKALVIDWVSSFKNMGPAEGKTALPGDAVRFFKLAGFTTGEMLPAGTHHFAFIATLPSLLEL